MHGIVALRNRDHEIERKANLDHIPEFHDLLASIFDIFGFARHEHVLQLLTNLAPGQSCYLSSRYGSHEHLWDILYRRILECCCLGHGGVLIEKAKCAAYFNYRSVT